MSVQYVELKEVIEL